MLMSVPPGFCNFLFYLFFCQKPDLSVQEVRQPRASEHTILISVIFCSNVIAPGTLERVVRALIFFFRRGCFSYFAPNIDGCP